MTRGTQPGLRFRTRKLSPKQPLTVLREDQIESNEYKELLENQYKVETGVEKSEENEYHLQQALAATLGRGSKDAEKIVPAPPAEESNDIKYDEQYGLAFPNPSTYIRFSQTVEETTGCQYNLNSEDDSYLRSYNSKKPTSAQCSEDDFEKIMEVFESTADRQTPFAAVDHTVVTYDTMELVLKQELDEKLQMIAIVIYEYWKSRRQSSANKSLQPSLKFEMHQDSDDGDPYVCFRRRDVRQTRKTRARDIQSTEKLRRLRKELEDGRQLVLMAQQRELAKRELIALDRQVFEQRAKVREVRLRLSIKVDDEDLINQKPKRNPSGIPPIQRQSGTQLRLPIRPDGRPIDADLTLLAEVQAQKENLLQMEIDQKVQQHQRWNQNHIDLTREPLSPVRGQGKSSCFRHATAQYLITPPASVSSDYSEHSSPTHERDEAASFRFASPIDDKDYIARPAYRRRIGRLGRLWIDRRGVSSTAAETGQIMFDRWKFDNDEDDDANEPPIYKIDPYDTKAIKFRATIPSTLSLHSRRLQPDAPSVNSTTLNTNVGSLPARPSSIILSAPT